MAFNRLIRNKGTSVLLTRVEGGDVLDDGVRKFGLNPGRPNFDCNIVEKSDLYIGV